MSHFGGYQYSMGLADGRYSCFIRVRLPSPLIWGCFTRAYLARIHRRTPMDGVRTAEEG